MSEGHGVKWEGLRGHSSSEATDVQLPMISPCHVHRVTLAVGSATFLVLEPTQ